MLRTWAQVTVEAKGPTNVKKRRWFSLTMENNEAILNSHKAERIKMYV